MDSYDQEIEKLDQKSSSSEEVSPDQYIKDLSKQGPSDGVRDSAKNSSDGVLMADDADEEERKKLSSERRRVKIE